MKPNERWSADFVHDPFAAARRIRILNIVDGYSRVCIGQWVDLSISGARMARRLDELRATRGLPKTLVPDNGPEFTSKAMFCWSRQKGVELHFIQPWKPTQNAFIESFNARSRELHTERVAVEAHLQVDRQVDEAAGHAPGSPELDLVQPILRSGGGEGRIRGIATVADARTDSVAGLA